MIEGIIFSWYISLLARTGGRLSVAVDNLDASASHVEGKVKPRIGSA